MKPKKLDSLVAINCKYLSINKIAEQKAINIIFADIMSKVSHLVPIHFLDKADGIFVDHDAGGMFIRSRKPWDNSWKAKSIGVVFQESFKMTIVVLLHEVGHFVYKDDYRWEKAFNDNDRAEEEILADTFVIDYIDSLPIWIQKTLSVIREVKKERLKKDYNVEIDDPVPFSEEEIYDSLKESNMLYLVEQGER